MKINILILVTLISFFSNAQTTIELEGRVRNDSVFLQNIQIINLTRKAYSISNDLGTFLIKAKLGDSLLFKSLAQKDRKIKISKTHINNAKILVYLESEVNKLDEVLIKNSFFNSEEYVNKYLTFDNSQLKKNPFSSYYANKKTKPNPLAMTDPTLRGNNIDIGAIVSALYYVILENKIEKNKQKRKKEKQIKIAKKKFSENIVEQFNKDFFTKKLNIHEDKVYLFIDYCNGNGLENFYNTNEIEIVNFFIIQSKKFNEIQN